MEFSPNAFECLQMLPNASEFLPINANLRKTAFGTLDIRKRNSVYVRSVLQNPNQIQFLSSFTCNLIHHSNPHCTASVTDAFQGRDTVYTIRYGYGLSVIQSK